MRINEFGKATGLATFIYKKHLYFHIFIIMKWKFKYKNSAIYNNTKDIK